jgi:hypothetical protein
MLRIFDFAVSIRSGSTMGDAWRQHYEGYEGLLHVLKLPRLNSLLTPPPPLSSTYLIKVYRRRLVLDPLHTPPEPGTRPRPLRCRAPAHAHFAQQRPPQASQRPAPPASSSEALQAVGSGGGRGTLAVAGGMRCRCGAGPGRGLGLGGGTCQHRRRQCVARQDTASGSRRAVRLPLPPPRAANAV